ncbi:Glycosyltransferase, GT2 family [Nocardioides terrae]|uniref:Glycosyltransferase, GT2 family n=1 Tax=Nocardioides terrae TaxID=574651 RepID=A0A1I1HZX0_9ACTN|nr:glycosyltransferase family 2 protein [Nocardioides terrae]SFC27508.1 Glycosyltransferase, GT2 family [Nocardioides terrae]
MGNDLPTEVGDRTQFGDLAIVVVNFGPPDLLRHNLVDVGRDLDPAQVVVVDNHSTDDVRRTVQSQCEEEGWAGVFPAVNTGYGTGNNLGARAAIAQGARFLLFLNPDARIDRRSVEMLLDTTRRDNSALVAPVIISPAGITTSTGNILNLDTGDMQSAARPERQTPSAVVHWVTGACFLVSVALWERVGGFDDDYFLYWEDVDLCARVDAAGGRIVVIAEATAVHQGGATHTTVGARAKSATYYYYNIRNRQIFAAKWLSTERQRKWRRSTVQSALRILLRGGRRQFLHPISPLTAAWRGVFDGRRLARTVGASTFHRSTMQ